MRRLTQQVERGAEKPYRITFEPLGTTVDAGPVEADDHHEGQPGSILDIALKNGVEISHSCGGFCACTTCHVYVKEGMEACNEPSEDEEDMLDEAAGVKMNSRLACQTVPDGSEDLVVEIPSWNRNEVGE